MKELHRSILLTDYMSKVEPTDKLPPDDLQPILLGLFGEVGSVMATAKKFRREGKAFAGYRRSVGEEFGDVLWYLAALCRRLSLRLDEILAHDVNAENYEISVATNDLIESPISDVATPKTTHELDTSLLELGEAASGLFVLRTSSDDALSRLITFANWYLRALKSRVLPSKKLLAATLPRQEDDLSCQITRAYQHLMRNFSLRSDFRTTSRSRLTNVIQAAAISDGMVSSLVIH
jgi:NTP pyrophosphatase (non-canonical NTP hydrolase)